MDFDTTTNLLQKLQDTALFKAQFSAFVQTTGAPCKNNLVTQSFMHIKNVLDMYAEVGQSNILLVYELISTLQDTNLPESTRWQFCTLSGIVCNKTLVLSPEHCVAASYRSWVYAVWMLTHISSIEKMRKHSKNETDAEIEPAHLSIYQQCLTLVIKSLVKVFPRILLRAKSMSTQKSMTTHSTPLPQATKKEDI